MNKRLVFFKSRLRVYLACVPYLFCRFFMPSRHAKNRGKTRILVFHHLDQPALFKKTLSAITRHYNLISFENYLQGEKSPDTINVIVAFDDGYRSWFEHGLALFRHYHVRPLLFVNSDFIGLGREHAHDYCQNNIMTWPEDSLNWQELAALEQAGAEIGGHTVGHRDLTAIDQESIMLNAIASDRTFIGEKLGKDIRSFAYPFGRHHPASVACAQKAGYRYAFSSDSGFAEESVSPFLLKRTNIGMRPPLVVLAMIEGWGDRVSDIARALKGKRYCA